MKKKNNKKLIIVCIFFLILAVITRYEISSSYFTSWDDLYPGYVQMTISELSRQEILNFLATYNLDLHNYFKNFPTSFLKILSTPYFIAKTTSNAPLQYLMNPLLIFSFINFAHINYNDAIFLARFQSFILSILFFIFYFFLIIKKVQKNSEKICLILVGGTIFLTSWPFLTLAGHGSNYANLLFCITILVLNIFFILKNNNLKSYIISSIAWVLLVLTNYQIIFFLPSALLTIFLLKKNQNIKDLFNFSILFSAIIICIFIMIFFLNLNKLEIDYTETKGAEASLNYLFSNSNYSGFFGFLLFIISNLTKVTYSVLAMGNMCDDCKFTFTIIVYILSILGAINLFKNNKLFFYFTIFSISTFLVLWFLSILAFTPTRHMIWLLFFLSILISYGFNFFIELTKFKKTFLFFTLAYVIIHISFFIFDYSKIKKNRSDPLLSLNIKEIITNNNINLIATYHLSYNLILQPFIRKNYEQVHNNNGLVILIKKNTKLKDYNINLLLYCSNGGTCINKLDGQIFNIKNRLKKLNIIQFVNHSTKKIEANNVITTISETFGNFTKINLKTQVFEIHKF